MLLCLFPKLKTSKAVSALREFFRSPFYLALIVLLMAVSEIFGLELVVLYLFVILAACALMVTDDSLATVPIACCGYMTISAPNNTARYPGKTIFNDPHFNVQLIFLLAVGVALLLTRLVLSILQRKPQKRIPRLLSGFLWLGAAYLLGGLFTSYYSGKTMLFAFTQLASLAAFYVYYYYTIDWSSVPKWYMPALFMGIGFGIFAEICGMYALPGVFTADGVDRTALITGWGVYNNVACIMAMCLPAPFYFAVTRKNGFLYQFVGDLFLLGVLLTQSRGGMIFGIIVYLICVIWTLCVTKGREKYNHFVAVMITLGAAMIASSVFSRQIGKLFASVIKMGMDSSNRISIYRACWKKFLQYPAFGVGFYQTPGFGFEYNMNHGAFIPPRAHNTVMQLLATGGIVALAAYAIHRWQTVKLLFGRPTKLKTFVAFSVLALLLTSLLDCHFFNIGPGILYGILLCFAENERKQKKLCSRAMRPA